MNVAVLTQHGTDTVMITFERATQGDPSTPVLCGVQVIHRLEESEIDGAILEDTLNDEDGDEALMDTLKVDALTVR